MSKESNGEMTELAQAAGYGGYADVARYLSSVTGTVINRQQVYMWHLRRAHNGFPAMEPTGLFSLQACQAWLENYWSTRQKTRQRMTTERLAS